MKLMLKYCACAVAMTVGISASANAQANCRLGDEIIVTGMSGQSPAPAETLSTPGSNFHALKRIANFERWNNACRTTAVFGRMPNADGATEEMTRELDECDGSSRDEIEVGFDERMEGGFITEIQVTTSGQSNPLQRRIKGVEIRTAVVTEACNLVRFEWTPRLADVCARNGIDYEEGAPSPLISSDERNNTDAVGNWQRCPQGYVGTGLVIQRGWGGVSALGLECREVIVRE